MTNFIKFSCKVLPKWGKNKKQLSASSDQLSAIKENFFFPKADS
jgi:hypothetical protein